MGRQETVRAATRSVELTGQPQKFGALLRRLRQFRKLTQKGLAKKSGLSQSAISSIERGGGLLDPNDLPALADALKIPAERLVVPYLRYQQPVLRSALMKVDWRRA